MKINYDMYHRPVLSYTCNRLAVLETTHDPYLSSPHYTAHPVLCAFPPGTSWPILVEPFSGTLHSLASHVKVYSTQRNLLTMFADPWGWRVPLRG